MDKKLVDPAFAEPESYELEIVPLNKDGVREVDAAKVTNPRLLLNLPADKMFIELTRTSPPYMVVVCRADQELNALGLLEKAKDMIKAFCMTLAGKRAELTRGVAEAAALLGAKGGGKA